VSPATTCTICELHAESTFRVEGMDCREEVALLERRFKHLVGLEDFTADLIGQRLHVRYDAAKVSASAIAAAVADAGMRAWLEHEEPIATGESGKRTRMLLLAGAALGLGAGLLAEFLHAPRAVALVLFGLSMASGIPLSARQAWRSLKARTYDINVLMLIAAAGAVVLGQWSEGAAVVFLFALAQLLEARTLERARFAVRALMELTPADAVVREAAGDRTVAIDSIALGAVVVVKPGARVPLDGDVVAGSSEVNQAPITGESLPVDKRPGDEIYAGSINGRGALEVRVTKFRKDTTLARIIHLVEQAQAQRAPAQTLVERFARVYTPAVIVLAVALAVVPPLAAGASWSIWTYRALVLLVVSCPCALVISTPVSVVAALAGAARKGVLIKGGAHLERVGRVRCVAFDKTGTLTTGTPEVVDVVAVNGTPSRTVLELAAAVERRSGHPIAQAIVRHAEALGVPMLPGAGVLSHAGRGAEGVVDGVSVMLGNHRMFEERALCSPELHQRVAVNEAQGRTSVLVARDGQPVGLITVADRLRSATRDAIDALRRQHVESIVMLSGDSEGTARAIAADAGVDEFRAGLLPEDKVDAVADLRRRYGVVAMVGDGVNDAPAMAAADIGIAMGAVGSDVALETADVALMADDLLKIPYALRLSRTTVRNIRANLAISLFLKLAFVVAAVVGVATLWMAILADTGASVIVVANALRLLRAD
jgi:Cd2+/Zn2+-exporting ATPase